MKLFEFPFLLLSNIDKIFDPVHVIPLREIMQRRFIEETGLGGVGRDVHILGA